MFQQLTPGIILSIIIGYFLLLIGVSYFTGKDANNANFFLAGRKSPWYLVAFGMVGATLSGVTFISVPGVVGAGGANQAFSYMQMVFGYLLGYAFIGLVLLPIYYRLNLTSIYGYLEKRFGFYSYKTGAAYFILSRTIGASFRLFLVAIVLQKFVMEPMQQSGIYIPFWLTVLLTIVLIWVYTFRGGIKTIVFTDTIQTVAMLTAVIFTIFAISSALETSVFGLRELIDKSGYSQVFFFEGGWSDPNNFFKQFLSGALITIVMTGLDQDMMQKNLSCKSLRESQLNMLSFSIVLVFANLLFLTLGALLYIYASHVGLAIPEQTDQLFPTVALQSSLPPIIGITFIIGLIAAAYSSADSALTSLTTSFCVDFLGFEQENALGDASKRTRFIVHIGFSLLLFLVILAFNAINNEAVITSLFKVAGYTYGPLLGLYSFGILTKLKVRDNLVIPICIAAPVISYLTDTYSSQILYGFEFGFLIIALNGLLTFLGLLAISYREYETEPMNTFSK